MALLAAFSTPWSLLVVTQHSYGGEGRIPQLFGTIMHFGIYLFPFSLFFALLLVWPTEHFSRERTGFALHGRRSLAWALVAGGSYIGSVATKTQELAPAATFCGVFGALIATLIYGFIVRR